MSILRVAQMGHPVLRTVSQPVDPVLIPTPEFQQFCEDMLETMDEYDGAGLAAPQVYTPLRVVCLVLDDDTGPEFLINPQITPVDDTVASGVEGCLSVAGMRGKVTRPDHIQVTALGRDGEPKAYELEGFPARVVQHECDHLDGILYVDRVEPMTLAFEREYNRWGSLDDYFSEDSDDLEEEA